MFLQNKSGKNLLLLSMFFLVLFLGNTLNVNAGWVQNKNGTYSYQEADGKTAVNRWIGKKYYVNARGIRVTGKKKIDSKWYFFSDPDGELQKEQWIKQGKERFYARKNGVLCADGIYTIGENQYLFNAKAVMKTGVYKSQGETYYFDRDGRMLKNRLARLDDGHLYFFGSDGTLVTGKWLADFTYYMDTKGRMIYSQWKGMRYIGSDGKSYSGLHKIAGEYYYFDPKTRKKVTNASVEINGVEWYFGDEGQGVKCVVPSPGKGVSVEAAYYTDPVVDDETLLSYIIYGEAGNQPYEGKLAVGYVIMNRVYSKTVAASTVREVIYQKSQFPTYRSVQKFYRNPSVINEESRLAAKQIIKTRAYFASGKTPTLTTGGKKIEFPYLFFMTPGSYRALHLSAPYLTIGNHVFFKTWK